MKRKGILTGYCYGGDLLLLCQENNNFVISDKPTILPDRIFYNFGKYTLDRTEAKLPKVNAYNQEIMVKWVGYQKEKDKFQITLTSVWIFQQVEYAGLIERIIREDQDSEEENEVEQEAEKELSFTIEYGITSLVDKKTVLQPGDKVHYFPCPLASS